MDKKIKGNSFAEITKRAQNLWIEYWAHAQNLRN